MKLETYSISSSRGFLPVFDPVANTGAPEFDATVGAIALNLPKVMIAGHPRKTIAGLPEMDIEHLSTILDEPQLAAVMRTYSYLTHAYVWGEAPPAKALPQNIARPFAAIAKHFDRPPVLSYESYALNNWARIDPAGPIEIGNIALLQNFLGGLDEEWFILIHVEIEAQAAPAIAQIPVLLDAAKTEDFEAVHAGLTVIAQALAEMHRTLARMTENCDPYIYYRRVRPYIHGWKNNPALPQGLIYQGVGDRAQFHRGETGAQSTIIPALDAVFGIDHEEDELSAYLIEMRAYMPSGHRAFLVEVERQSRLRAFVKERGGSILHKLYNTCIEHIAAFRALHLEFAASYIHAQAESGDNPVHIGTGGTPFMKYLKKHRDESTRHLIVSPP